MIDPGWIGLVLGLLVAPPQLVKILKTKRVSDISFITYGALCLALVFYLWHAIIINDLIFIVAQALNLTTNTVILILMVKYR